MQKFIIAVICVLGIVTAYAENENAATSKEYVDTAIATKQPTIPAEGANVVMTFDSNADDGIGMKQIYDESASYASQENALVTAGNANAAVQMAIQGEFECVLYDPDNPTDCWWWNIKTAQRLPAGYTELEYLGGTGTQWIDTGVLQSNNIGVAVKYAYTELASATYIFGSYGPHYYLGINSSFSQMVASYGHTGGNVVLSIPISNVVVNQPYEFNINYYNSGRVEFVGIKSAQLAPKTFSANTVTMGIFAAIDSGFSNKSKSRIYYMRITDGDSLVRNFIPARQDSTGTLGMYDTVTNTFYTNAGTGTFIAGPVASYIPQNVQ